MAFYLYGEVPSTFHRLLKNNNNDIMKSSGTWEIQAGSLILLLEKQVPKFQTEFCESRVCIEVKFEGMVVSWKILLFQNAVVFWLSGNKQVAVIVFQYHDMYRLHIPREWSSDETWVSCPKMLSPGHSAVWQH